MIENAYIHREKRRKLDFLWLSNKIDKVFAILIIEKIESKNRREMRKEIKNP